MLLEKLSKGCLSSLAELKPKEGQIFRATNVDGELEAVDFSAGQIKETDDAKIMTADERNKVANIDKRFDELTAGQIKETDKAKIMTADERNKLAGVDKQIDARFNACVTDTRVFGYGEFGFNPADGGKASFDNPVPSGYSITGLWKINAAWEVISYRQPQVFIANRGWFPLGSW